MYALLSSEASLPIETVGWVVLLLGLLFVAAWIAGVYR
jgi:hypothetical protein